MTKKAEKLMKEFHELGGGTEADKEFTTKEAEKLKKGLQESFDKKFPSTKFKIGDRVTVQDRQMKTHTFNGEVTGIESNTDNPVYNVLIELMILQKDGSLKSAGKTRNINFLESQITKEVKSV